MAVGIERFQEHFAGHEAEYVLIGGAACDLVFAEAEDFRFTKVAVDQGVLSLSAILLDENYYAALQQHKVTLNGVSILDEKLLIPFKAKAFLDLTKRQRDGERVDNDDIKKHRNDVYRLAQLLAAETSIALPDAICADLRAYLDEVDGDASFDPKTFDVPMSKQEGATLLRTVYGL